MIINRNTAATKRLCFHVKLRHGYVKTINKMQQIVLLSRITKREFLKCF